MKPTIKQLDALQREICIAFQRSRLTYAEISKLSEVDQSQVGRICKGSFRTFSHNVVRICNVLDVEVPRIELRPSFLERELTRAGSSLFRIWDRTPEGAKAIQQLLDAVVDLQKSGRPPGPGGLAD